MLVALLQLRDHGRHGSRTTTKVSEELPRLSLGKATHFGDIVLSEIKYLHSHLIPGAFCCHVDVAVIVNRSSVS